jgi:hypothetical protein
MADDHGQSPSGNSPQPKKTFEPPRLTVYGDIASLTKTVGRTGLVDGGKGTTKATRP